jgi:ABC-type antimicrobial peptide transport system permease subunit
MPELRQMIFLDNMGGIIFLFFMLLLVGFELFNTTTMSVMERMREFGILQAIGMQPGSIVRVVLVELLLKLGMAVALSALLSGILLWYLHGNPIPLTAELTEMYEEFGFSVESLLFSTRPAVFLEPFVSILVIALLTTIYPVVRVFRLDITAALRRET